MFRLPDANDLRQWAQDALEDTDPDQPDDQLEPAAGDRPRACSCSCARRPPAAARRSGHGVEATDPFGRATAGVELLTFHAAKGREWHTVHLAGCETSLVPHRSATTGAARAEEARLLYVAATRATDELVIHWAQPARRLPAQADPAARRLREHHPAARATTTRPGAASRDRTREVRLERLRAWRAGAARQGGLLPELLCTDAALAAIADHRPGTAEELDAVTGLGVLTSRRLIAGIQDALTRRVTQSRSTITGAWSLGDWPLRALRSTMLQVQRSATDAEPSTRSIRRPRPWWKSPAR